MVEGTGLRELVCSKRGFYLRAAKVRRSTKLQELGHRQETEFDTEHLPSTSIAYDQFTPAQLKKEDMDLEQERLRADAETLRQRQELGREAAERARVSAENARVVVEDGRRVAAIEVRETVATLTTLLQRMEAVEALRRARANPDSH